MYLAKSGSSISRIYSSIYSKAVPEMKILLFIYLFILLIVALEKELVGKMCTTAHLTRESGDCAGQIVTQNDLITWM